MQGDLQHMAAERTKAEEQLQEVEAKLDRMRAEQVLLMSLISSVPCTGSAVCVCARVYVCVRVCVCVCLADTGTLEASYLRWTEGP